MLHTKSQRHQSISSGEDFFLQFNHIIWAWRPCWSYDLDRLNEFLFPKPTEALIRNLITTDPMGLEAIFVIVKI